MEKQVWIDHLKSWKSFLYERLSASEDIGDRVKIERQLRTLERVQCGAVLNPALLSDFINANSSVDRTLTCDSFSLELNESQKRAVNNALGNSNLSLIQGPPGTGKTQVIAEICLQLCHRNPGIRILVCSETHVAVNNLISRIADCDDSIRIVRIRDRENDDTIDAYALETIVQSFVCWTSENYSNDEAIKIVSEELQDTTDKSLEKALALSANITGITCNRVASYAFRDMTEMFDVAIIDEACKATLPEILAPLIISNKAILLGDPKQLPPVFCSEEREIIKSIENCNLNKFMYIDTLFSSEKAVFLDTQYRMSCNICSMISRLFYDDELRDGRNTEIEDDLVWVNYRPTRKWPVDQKTNTDRPHIYNLDECNIIADLIDQLLDKGDTDLTIAVISPYRSQVFHLREKCQKSDRIKIDTVDGFQGKEADIVIFSVTRTWGIQRFLADKRRLNVALSRARNKIIIMGNSEYCEKSPLLLSVRDYCNIIECKGE